MGSLYLFSKDIFFCYFKRNFFTPLVSLKLRDIFRFDYGNFINIFRKINQKHLGIRGIFQHLFKERVVLRIYVSGKTAVKYDFCSHVNNIYIIESAQLRYSLYKIRTFFETNPDEE